MKLTKKYLKSLIHEVQFENQLRKVIQEQIEDELTEESESAKEAHKRGLESAGWGRWKDPKTGKIVAQTQDGKLVKISTTSKEKIQKPSITSGAQINMTPVAKKVLQKPDKSDDYYKIQVFDKNNNIKGIKGFEGKDSFKKALKAAQNYMNTKNGMSDYAIGVKGTGGKFAVLKAPKGGLGTDAVWLFSDENDNYKIKKWKEATKQAGSGKGYIGYFKPEKDEEKEEKKPKFKSEKTQKFYQDLENDDIEGGYLNSILNSYGYDDKARKMLNKKDIKGIKNYVAKRELNKKNIKDLINELGGDPEDKEQQNLMLKKVQEKIKNHNWYEAIGSREDRD